MKKYLLLFFVISLLFSCNPFLRTDNIIYRCITSMSTELYTMNRKTKQILESNDTVNTQKNNLYISFSAKYQIKKCIAGYNSKTDIYIDLDTIKSIKIFSDDTLYANDTAFLPQTDISNLFSVIIYKNKKMTKYDTFKIDYYYNKHYTDFILKLNADNQNITSTNIHIFKIKIEFTNNKLFTLNTIPIVLVNENQK